MERRPTSILTTLAVSVLALTLIAPWSLGQDPDPITEIRRQTEQGDGGAQHNLGFMYSTGRGVLKDSGSLTCGSTSAVPMGTKPQEHCGAP